MRCIKFMPDYGCFPLWETMQEGSENVDPNSLPISASLKSEIDNWASIYDATLNEDDPINSGFKSELEEEEFRHRGMELANRLSSELGDSFKITVSL
jgi:hypothetical protein